MTAEAKQILRKAYNKDKPKKRRTKLSAANWDRIVGNWRGNIPPIQIQGTTQNLIPK